MSTNPFDSNWLDPANDLVPVKEKGTLSNLLSPSVTSPMGAVQLFTMLSPVILASCVTSLSFVFQNFKGLIYLAFLLAASLLRSLVYMYNGAEQDQEKGETCNRVRFTSYGNSTYSTFVIAFTAMYLIIPMFSNKNVNYWIFSALLVLFALDTSVKYVYKCVAQTGDLVLNALAGLGIAATFVSMMYAGGSGQYLFFNETSDGRQICYQPKDQTFKCRVTRNGETTAAV